MADDVIPHILELGSDAALILIVKGLCLCCCRVFDFGDDLFFYELDCARPAFFRFRLEQLGVDLQVKLTLASLYDLTLKFDDALFNLRFDLSGVNANAADNRQHVWQPISFTPAVLYRFATRLRNLRIVRLRAHRRSTRT